MKYLFRYRSIQHFQERRIPVKRDKECPYRKHNWCTKLLMPCNKVFDRCRIYHKEIPLPKGRVDPDCKEKQAQQYIRN